MQILITGATGQVGSAVLDALVRAGHQATALVRTPQKAEAIAVRGVRPIIGDLASPATYAQVAAEADAVVHAAYDDRDAQALDRAAIDILLAAVARRAASGRPAALIYTSGTWVIGNTVDAVNEQTPLMPPDLMAWRPAHEQQVLAAATANLRTMVVRPGIVYGGARGLIADMLKEAANGIVRVVGKGKNHWPCVYDRDLADLYVRLLASADAGGVYHANDEADERVEEIVDAIVSHARMKPDVRHMPLPEARAKLGPLAEALALDQRVRSERARAIGWAPTLHSVAGNVARLLEEFRDGRAAA
jgi:nucleoside-diphosphate-sugar epimerase